MENSLIHAVLVFWNRKQNMLHEGANSVRIHEWMNKGAGNYRVKSGLSKDKGIDLQGLHPTLTTW